MFFEQPAAVHRAEYGPAILENEERGVQIACDLHQPLRQHMHGRIGNGHRVLPRNLQSVQFGGSLDDTSGGWTLRATPEPPSTVRLRRVI